MYTPTCKPDWTVLHIKCPRCSRVITSRELFKNGLECGVGCNATMTELAAQCGKKYDHLCYLFLVNGVVVYVGSTDDFPSRMCKHGSIGKLAHINVAMLPNGLSNIELTTKDPMAKVSGWEYKMRAAGIKLHVSLHASELLLYTIQPKKPAWNLVPPPKDAVYRCVRLRENGTTRAHIYQPNECKHRDAEALCLRMPSYKYVSTPAVEWTACRPRTTTETESLLDEIEVPGIGMVSAFVSIVANGKTQQTLVREGVKVPAYIRVGHCELYNFYSFCFCKIPCVLKWKLAGEPESRRAYRFKMMETRQTNLLQRQGMMASDDKLTRRKVKLAMAVDEAIESLKLGRKPMKFAEMSLLALMARSSDLTLGISSLRAGQFYDDEYFEVRKDTRRWEQVYAQDTVMNVKRV